MNWRAGEELKKAGLALAATACNRGREAARLPSPGCILDEVVSMRRRGGLVGDPTKAGAEVARGGGGAIGPAPFPLLDFLDLEVQRLRFHLRKLVFLHGALRHVPSSRLPAGGPSAAGAEPRNQVLPSGQSVNRSARSGRDLAGDNDAASTGGGWPPGWRRSRDGCNAYGSRTRRDRRGPG